MPAQPKTKNLAAPAGKTVAEKVRQSNRFRDSYNPLRGLVISKVVALLEQAERGDFAEIQLLNRKVERRFPVVKALKSRRLSALQKLDWDIKVVDTLPPGYMKEHAARQQKFLRSRYELICNLREVIGFLALAEFRGYSILQKHRFTKGGNDGAVKELHWLPQSQFQRDGEFGCFYFNQDGRFGASVATLGEQNRIGSAALPRSEFVIRECSSDTTSPLYEIALMAFINWLMARKDWAAFVEIFGLPNSVVIMPPNIPTGKEDEYQASAEKVAEGVSGALPAGSDVKFPAANVRWNAPFQDFSRGQEEDVVLAGTGGLLAMLSTPTGIGQGASKQHGDAFKAIAQADALKISETLQRDFDKQELAAEFPGQPVLAYFELASPCREDVNSLVERVVKLAGVGLYTSDAEISEKTGLKIKRKPA